MRFIRIKTILFLLLLICTAFCISPVTAYTSYVNLVLTPGDSWSNYYIVSCSGSITGENVDNITSWEIDFDGDTNPDESGSSASISASHTYPKQSVYSVPDVYDVTITITYDGGTSYESSQPIDGNSVTIEEPDLVPSVSIVPNEATFTIDYSSDTEGADTHTWNFGDGDSSTNSVGSHTYSVAGIYNVTLTVRSEAGQTDDYEEDVIFTEPTTEPTTEATTQATQSLNPNAYFTVDYDKGSAPLYVRFTDESTKNTVSYEGLDEWEWVFDYGNYGDSFDADDSDFEDADTEFTYNYVGTYTPSLTVTDDDGYYDTYQYESIEVVSADDAPVADFDFYEGYSDYGVAPFTVKFEDLSDESENSGENLDEWHWEFYVEDNDDIDVIKKTYYSSTDPQIEFEEAGVYTVRLTVVDDDGYCSTKIEEDFFEVTSTLSATFSASPTSGTVPLTVSFTANPGDYDVDEYDWSFGDGKSSSETDTTTSHTYSSPGTYKVSLTIYSGSKSYTTSQKTITVNQKSTVTTATTYPIETTSTVTPTATQVSAGTKIFGLPGTEYFRTEIGRFYDFYKEYTSLLAGLFGMG